MADLAGASAVEENADWVVLIWPDEAACPEAHKNIRLRIAKNRYGVADDCKQQVWLDGIAQKFKEMDYENVRNEKANIVKFPGEL